MNGKTRSHTAAPLGREHMPGDYSISLAAYTGRGTPEEARIPKDFGPSQPMRGFEETYRNIIDYIVRITYRIWEERDVEYILDCYAPDSRVFDDYGLQRGNEKIVSDTRHTTGAFSNIQLIADEVIWAGNDEIGFHTSHRTIIRGTNDGPSKYGPATGRTVDFLVIANCVALENDIFLEHVLYNTSGMLQQLGLDVADEARRLARDPFPGWPRSGETWNELRQSVRPARPLSDAQPVSGFDVDRFVRQAFDAVMVRRDVDRIESFYAPSFAFAGPTNRKAEGAGAFAGALSSIWRCFSDLEAEVDEVYWMGNETDGFLVSTRWSAGGTHDGGSLYGPPTGARVQIWGITQQEIRDGRIAREWLLFNELDVLMQIEAARAAAL